MTEEVTDAMHYADSLRYMKEAPTDEQRQHVLQSQLYLHGDAWLVWVNEGDLHNLAMRSASNSPTTEEVTDAMLRAGEAAEVAWDRNPTVRPSLAEVRYLAMRSASNSPTTNGEAARIPAAPDDVERVLRAFADKHSACGEAWNLSSVLACVRSAIPIPAPTGEAVEQAYLEGYCDGVGEPDSKDARYWWERSCAREALTDHTAKDDHIRAKLAEIESFRANLPPAERAELERLELIAQRESWIRAMAPCEHGVPDFEQCSQCRNPTTKDDLTEQGEKA